MAIKEFGKKMSDSLRDAADAVKAKAAQAEMPDLKKIGEKACLLYTSPATMFRRRTSKSVSTIRS